MKTGIWKQDILVMGKSSKEKVRSHLIQFCSKGWKAENRYFRTSFHWNSRGKWLGALPPQKQEAAKRIPH